jgi:Zn-dependent peptidase ImmA (M78 family)
MVMHALPGDDDEKMEREADEFASAFLMPPVEIRPHLVPPSIEKFGRVKCYWKVSIKSIIRRARDLRLISPDDYRRLSIVYSKAGYSRGEPFPLDREAPALLPEMIDFHLKDLRYSVADLAKLLLIEEDEFRRVYLPHPRLKLVVSR